MIRVAVAARSGVVRAGLEAIVRSSAAMELAGALDLALVSAIEIRADVILLDAGEFPPDRLAAFAQELASPIVLLVDPEDEAAAHAALAAGIRGLIRVEAGAEEIEGAIHAVHAGLIAVSPGLLHAVTPQGAHHNSAEPAEPLSDREQEVLEAMAEGLSNKLIAHQLAISEHTVKTHVASILAKLGASSRTEAVSRAIRLGLVML